MIRSLERQIIRIRDSIVKTGSSPKSTINLRGKLEYSEDSGWILLSVPNLLVRAFFASIDDNDIELPKNSKGKLNAHISVMTPDDLRKAGGMDAVESHLGRTFLWGPKEMQEVVPDRTDVSKVWFLKVDSPGLADFRKSLGLPPSPRYPFHLTVAERPKT